jgi:Ca2+/Na+ antiporter
MFSREISRKGGAILALLIPTCIVLGSYALLFGFTHTADMLREEWPFMIVQIALFSIPFWVIALAGARRITVWVFVTLVSAAFWAWFVSRVLASAESETGVDFGAVFIMLGAPIFISLAGVVFDRTTRRDRN